MKKRKIIHIYHRAYNAYFPREDSEAYYLAGWSGAVARRTVEYSNKYVIENWRPERNVHGQVAREVGGVVCRLFPSICSGNIGDWSPLMLRELRTQAKKHEILIHHSSIHSHSLYLISSIFRYVPIIAQHHGDSPSLVRYNRNGRLRTLMSHFIEKRSICHIDHFFILHKAEEDFLLRCAPKSRISLQTMGVNFNEFRPIDRMLARRQLKLPKNKRILLYVGRFYRLKGVDIILKAYTELKQKYDIELVLVGGSKTDELYSVVRSSGSRIFHRLPHDELPTYYSAADVYLLPVFSPDYAGGIGVAVIESLACRTPVVSTTLVNFPTRERQKLGEIPKDKEDVARCVSRILDNPSSYLNCREIAMRCYDWENIIRRTVEIYDGLFERYYREICPN